MSPHRWVLALYLVFFVYFLFSGVRLARTLSVLYTAGFYGSISGFALGAVAASMSLGAGIATFFYTTMFVSFITMLTFALRRTRETILPESSPLDVVCLNVLMLALHRPPTTYAFLDMFFQGAFHLLLNPLVLLMPPSLGFALSLWPSVLALRVAALGDKVSVRSRTFLHVWVQLMSIVWVLPTALSSLKSRETESLLGYVNVAFACLGLVFVVLTWVALNEATTSGREAGPRASFAGAAANHMNAGSFPPFVLVLAGICTYFVASISLARFLDLQTAASIGFVFIVTASALLGRRRPQLAYATDTGIVTRWPRLSWLVGGIVLVLVITGVRPFATALLIKQSRNAANAASQDGNYPLLTSIAASSRRCALEDFGEFRLVCPGDTRTLAELPHPAGFEIPVGVFASEARDFELVFGERTLNCIEIPARSAVAVGAHAKMILLFIYVPGAVSGSRHAWIVDRDASCARVVELGQGTRTGNRNGFGYVLHDETALAQGRRIAWLAEFVPARSDSGQKQGAEP